ncbi:O-antigen ligase family protein [Dactylosporangium sp. CS-033363]|uniref:O-antigen ligase family protein n=1 Tax=Dactylosporangium sp. CS-033363 TaxID=3239935 RepID=UPI003D8C2993
MARVAGVIGWAGLAAFALGALGGWSPSLLVALFAGVAALWGLYTPQRLNYTLFAVMFLVPATVDFGYPTYPEVMILLTATAIAVYGRIQRFDPAEPIPVGSLVVFALPVVCVLTALANWRSLKDVLIGVLSLGCYSIITWHVVDEARRDGAAMRRLALGFAWLGVPIALLAVYQRLSGTWPVLDEFAVSPAFTSGAGVGRSAGTMGHPIVYGTYCMMSMCAALALRGTLWRLPFAAGAAGLLLSGSRSAWIGIACALAYWYLTLEKKFTRRGVTLVAAGLVAGGALVLAGPAPVRNAVELLRARLTNLTQQDSATARYRRSGEAWDGIWSSAHSVVFGEGAEAHTRFFREVGIDDGLAAAFDNSFLTLWYDYGIVAVLVLCGLLVFAFVRYRSPAARLMLIGFVAQIYFFDFYLWPCAAAMLVLAVGLGEAERDRDAAPVPPDEPRHPLRLALLR